MNHEEQAELNNARTLTEATRQDLVKARIQVDEFKALISDWSEDMEWLRKDIADCEDKGNHRITLHHHDCMSGTSCDACRVLDRIRGLSQQMEAACK